MSDFNALKFVADNAGLNIFKALEKAYEQGVTDATPKWIPVSERMPVEKQDVLIMFNNNMAVGFWEETLEDGNPVWYANSGDGWFTGTENVDSDGMPIAWMPLPKPWEGEVKQNET